LHPLSQLTSDPSNIAAWHVFLLLSNFGVCPFFHGAMRKATKKFMHVLCRYINGD
jgi:hypothetical protein